MLASATTRPFNHICSIPLVHCLTGVTGDYFLQRDELVHRCLLRVLKPQSKMRLRSNVLAGIVQGDPVNYQVSTFSIVEQFGAS